MPLEEHLINNNPLMKPILKYYILVFFKPHRNWYGFLAVLLLTLTLTLSIIIVYIYNIYHKKIVEQIKGIYPSIYWYGRLNPDDTFKDVKLSPEVFLLKKIIRCSHGNSERMIEIMTGVRAINLEFIDKNNKNILRETSKENFGSESVWLSERLYQSIFEANKDKYVVNSRIFLKTWNERWEEVKIMGYPFPLETGEKWIIMPMELWKKIDDKTYGQPNIVSIYPADNNDLKKSEVPKKIREKYSIFTWQDRAPFYYRALFAVMEKGIQLFLLISISLVFIYFTSLIMMFFIEQTVGLNLIRLFGCGKFQVFIFITLSMLIIGFSTIGLAGFVSIVIIAIKASISDILPYINLSTFFDVHSWLSLRDILWAIGGMTSLAIASSYSMLRAIFMSQPAMLLDG